jgi:hypothetical protein
MVTGLRRLCGAVVVALAATLAQAQDLVLDVTPETGRALARQALLAGNPDLAARIAAQLVAADPDDVVALLLLTAGLSRSGHGAEAAEAGRRSYHLADTQAQRFEAAYLTAEALSIAGRPGAAKLWLRRADTQAPGDAERSVLREAYRDLDGRTPLKFSASVGGGPTDNVNGGSLHDTFYFEGIPIEIAEALPGWALTETATLSYRLLREPYRSATLYATLQHRNVWLNDRARVLQPDATNADYLYDSLDFGGSVDWLSTDRLVMHLNASAGRRWLGGAVQSDQQSLSFGVIKQLPGGRAARLDLSVETTQIPDTPRANSLRLAAEATLMNRGARGNLDYSLTLAQVDADAPGVAYRALTMGVNWQPEHPLKGVDLSLFADLGAKDYWKTFDRPDLTLAVGVTAQFPNAALWGFRPSMTLSASRTMSDVVVRDIASVNLTFGWISAF